MRRRSAYIRSSAIRRAESSSPTALGLAQPTERRSATAPASSQRSHSPRTRSTYVDGLDLVRLRQEDHETAGPDVRHAVGPARAAPHGPAHRREDPTRRIEAEAALEPAEAVQLRHDDGDGAPVADVAGVLLGQDPVPCRPRIEARGFVHVRIGRGEARPGGRRRQGGRRGRAGGSRVWRLAAARRDREEALDDLLVARVVDAAGRIREVPEVTTASSTGRSAYGWAAGGAGSASSAGPASAASSAGAASATGSAGAASATIGAGSAGSGAAAARATWIVSAAGPAARPRARLRGHDGR